MNYTTTEYVNPYGTVPCLYVDGKGVFESPIICEFVEDKWPDRGTKLMPDGRRDCFFFLPWACLPCPGSDIDRPTFPSDPHDRAAIRLLISHFNERTIPPLYRWYATRHWVVKNN